VLNNSIIVRIICQWNKSMSME